MTTTQIQMTEDNHSESDDNHSDSDDNHLDLLPPNDEMPIDNDTIYLDDSTIDMLPAQLDNGQLLMPSLLSDTGNDTVQEHAVRKVLGPGRADEVMVRGYGIVLRRQDMWTLDDCGG